ncbi:MAG: hypothetical protein IPM96_22115 [Ignavibacteria bacterium]|nr:hypothetical protein [Ignavibacteria bacterium]
MKNKTQEYMKQISQRRNGSSLSSGVYFYSLFAGEELVVTKKNDCLK